MIKIEKASFCSNIYFLENHKLEERNREESDTNFQFMKKEDLME